MYFPYLRGKQYELLLLRELAGTISSSHVLPILEPVKDNMSGIIKVLDAANNQNLPLILVVNPAQGDFRESSELIDRFSEEVISRLDDDYPSVVWGVVVNEEVNVDQLEKIIYSDNSRKVALIHNTSHVTDDFFNLVNDCSSIAFNIFIEDKAQRRYRRKFTGSSGIKVLIRDGFKKQNSNRDYPPVEHFSELHLTYADEGVSGFGDFLISGEGYSTSGGPAYAVAIHVTYLDPEDEDDMYISHYISDRNDSPVDPGGKFQEALEKLVKDVNKDRSKIFRSESIQEFLQFYENDHYPGLGYVKKLSMKHHIELLQNYLIER